MKKYWFFGAAFLAILSIAPAARANIMCNFENPPRNLPASGISLISGWAFAEGDDDIEIRLRIDGVTQNDIEIPCCGERPDVDATVPGAPDDTGFGLLYNFARFSAGPHTLGIDIRTDDTFDDLFGDEERKVVDHSVVIVRPGNAEVLSSVNLAGANCMVAPSGDALLINNVALDSGSASTMLEAQYATSSQSFVITDASGAPALTSFVAHLNGSQEVPLVQTSATGEATITLNPDNSLTCLVTTTDLADATVAHLHPAFAGEEGPPLINLMGGPPTWTCPNTPLTAAQVDDLRSGKFYVNVHTPEHPDGEARGQVVAASL